MLSKEDAKSKSFRKTLTVSIQDIGTITVADVSGRGMDALAAMGEKVKAGTAPGIDYLNLVLYYGMADESGRPFFDSIEEAAAFSDNIPASKAVEIRDAIYAHNKLKATIEDEIKN